MPRFRRRYAKRKSYRRRTGKQIRKTHKSVFRRRVMHVLNRSAETKTVQFDLIQQSIYPVTSIDFDAAVTVISPSNEVKSINQLLLIEQETGQGNHVGNKISTVSASIKGVIRPQLNFDNTINYNPCPMYVVI